MTIVLILVGTAMMVSAFLAVYAGWRGVTLGARPFSLLMFAITWWCLGVLLGIASPDLPSKLFWAKFVFFPIVTVPVAWLAFVLEYTGRAQWLSRRNVFLLSVEPVITLVLAWTNEAHGLIYPSTRLDLSSGYPMVQATFGIWFWVHAFYAYALILIGTTLLVWTTFRLAPVYRRQAMVLLFGSLFPWFSNILSISGLNPIPALDLTPIAFTLSGIAFAWGLFRLGLLDLVPVARDLVIEQMSDGLMVSDARDRILDANPALQHVIGLPMEKIIGSPADAIIPTWRRFAQPNQQSSAGHQISLDTSDGRREYILRITPLFDQHARLTGRVVMLHDVTDLKNAEQALHQAKNAAEASDRARGNFLATVSYELRTPLTTITGYSSTLLAEVNEKGPKNLARYLERINTASHHLLSLVNRLLDLTKVDMRTMPLSLKIFDFVGVVQDAIQSVQPLADQNSDKIQVSAPEAIAMYADKDKTYQVMAAILENACKYTCRGTITVNVQQETSPDTDWITVSVQDTGQGISPDQLPEIFEPFTQADHTRVREFGGTGLSLPLSQRYCKMMNGSIQVVSQLGKGSTFTVRLPKSVEPLATGAPAK